MLSEMVLIKLKRNLVKATSCLDFDYSYTHYIVRAILYYSRKLWGDVAAVPPYVKIRKFGGAWYLRGVIALAA
jgi:hypothetical protein